MPVWLVPAHGVNRQFPAGATPIAVVLVWPEHIHLAQVLKGHMIFRLASIWMHLSTAWASMVSNRSSCGASATQTHSTCGSGRLLATRSLKVLSSADAVVSLRERP